MKTKDKLRLAALRAKADRTTEENAELLRLETAAKEAKLDPEQIAKDFAPDEDAEGEGEGEGGEDEGEDGEKSLSDEELGKLIGKAVSDAVQTGSGVDTAKLMAEIQKASKNGLTAEDVDTIVKKHVGGTGINQEELLKEVKKLVAKSGKDAEDRLLKTLDKFAASQKTPSKNQFQTDYERDFPFESRIGNLSVARKQLANICIANLSETRLEEMKAKGAVVPTGMNHGISEEQLKHAANRGRDYMERARHATLYGGKALTTEGVGSGAELIPTDLSSDLMARMYLESQIASELMAAEIDMPTNPFEFPLTTTRTNFYTGSENPNSDPTSSDPGTGNIILKAEKLIGMSEYSYEAEEDAIVAMLPLLQNDLGQGAADAFEGAIINGDTSATHMDSDAHAVAGHHAKLFKGWRKYALAGGAALTLSLASGGIGNAGNIKDMRKKLKRWGIRPRDLMLVVGPQGYNELVTLDETLTFEKVGNQAAARILTGEAASVFGIRIVVSSQIREDLNASGVYDGSTTTKGSALLVHRPSWLVGVKRGFTVEVDVNKKSQMNAVIASFRRAFVPKETPSATVPSVILGFGYTA